MRLRRFLTGIALMCAALAGRAQDLNMINAQQIEQWRKDSSGAVHVVNFWATWCGPCVAELPAFEQLNKRYAAQGVKVTLVSTDFKRDIDKRVKPFILDKGLRSEVAFMDERNPNDWINTVNPEWSGTIPATWIVCGKKGVELFFEEPLTYEQLEAALKKCL